MWEIFQYSFMVRAFAAGIMVAVIAPLIGTFLVTKRYALIADTLSHVALAGVAIGLLVGWYPLYTTLAIVVVAALLLEWLRTEGKVSGDAVLALFLSGGLAIAIVLIGIAHGFNVDLFSYLFGSITTVQPVDLWVIAAVGAMVLLITWLLYKELLYLSFDSEAATVSGLKTRLINSLLVMLAAVTVVLSLRIVGVLLISALMVIPVLAAAQIARSFKQTIALAVLVSLLAVIGGLFSSYYLNLAPGGTIVLLTILIFIVLKFWNKFSHH